VGEKLLTVSENKFNNKIMPQAQRRRPFVGFTVDPETDRLLRARAERERRPLSRVADEALRRGLDAPDTPPVPLASTGTDGGR
jgi:methylmalonyl-CoA mutase N-terminal domain/subunit